MISISQKKHQTIQLSSDKFAFMPSEISVSEGFCNVSKSNAIVQ